MFTIQNMQAPMASSSNTQAHHNTHSHTCTPKTSLKAAQLFSMFYNQRTQEATFQRRLAPLSPVLCPLFLHPSPLYTSYQGENRAHSLFSKNRELSVKIWQLFPESELITFKCLELQNASNKVTSKGLALIIA